VENNNNNKLVHIESNNNGNAGVSIKGNGDNTIVSPPKVQGNSGHGFYIQGAGTNKPMDVDIKDNTSNGIFSFGGIAEVHGGVIEKNGFSGAKITGGTTTIKEVVIKENEKLGCI
jgi:hypothetical protein